ncbi:MAG: Ig-like domain-containing protein [Lachnospiraceae bacterium]|nr:Ig-like domain-containing protein [Lachnospiraceae bacterium]
MKHKYKAAAIAMSLMLAVISVVAANPATGEAGVRLNKKKATLYVGKSMKLKVLGTKKKAKWSSSNESVAVVSGSGKVYAFKTGTAKITAKVKKKKYVCKVTVKKKKKSKKPVQVTPIRTAAPTVTPMPTATVTPIPTATPIVTKAPDVNNNVNTITNSTLAANIETSLEKLPSGQIIAKVTNKNSVNVDYYTLNFQFKDAKGTVLGTDKKSGYALSKGASQYVLTYVSSDKAEKTDVNKSQISVTADKDFGYLDGSADMQITAEPTESRGVAVTFKNKSSHYMTGYALIVFKDAKGKMVAVSSTSCGCSAGETKFDDVSAPVYQYDTDEHQWYDDVEYATAEVLNYSYYNSDLDLSLDN